MTTKLITVATFVDRAKKESLLVNSDLEKAIVSQTDSLRIIGDELMEILLKMLRETNVRELGVYTTATIIIGALK
ncbi:MAG: hypothetical protein HZC04_00205 [Candidatus Lloydbacteria bacterium]|nr:hypothetical protein [Candidatus Lloydbacteria bacterium]